MDAIERLEAWNNGHKNRSVCIDIDDGYGAACWTVRLTAGKREVVAIELQFIEGPLPDFGVVMNERCGLTKLIHAAIDRAEKLKL